MLRVIDLIPGELHIHPHSPSPDGPRFGVYVCQVPHPLYRSLQLVVWRLSDGRYSMDALVLNQEIPTKRVVYPSDVRLNHLRWALGQDIPAPVLPPVFRGDSSTILIQEKCGD